MKALQFPFQTAAKLPLNQWDGSCLFRQPQHVHSRRTGKSKALGSTWKVQPTSGPLDAPFIERLYLVAITANTQSLSLNLGGLVLPVLGQSLDSSVMAVPAHDTSKWAASWHLIPIRLARLAGSSCPRHQFLSVSSNVELEVAEEHSPLAGFLHQPHRLLPLHVYLSGTFASIPFLSLDGLRLQSLPGLLFFPYLGREYPFKSHPFSTLRLSLLLWFGEVIRLILHHEVFFGCIGWRARYQLCSAPAPVSRSSQGCQLRPREEVVPRWWHW